MKSNFSLVCLVIASLGNCALVSKDKSANKVGQAQSTWGKATDVEKKIVFSVGKCLGFVTDGKVFSLLECFDAKTVDSFHPKKSYPIGEVEKNFKSSHKNTVNHGLSVGKLKGGVKSQDVWAAPISESEEYFGFRQNKANLEHINLARVDKSLCRSAYKAIEKNHPGIKDFVCAKSIGNEVPELTKGSPLYFERELPKKHWQYNVVDLYFDHVKVDGQWLAFFDNLYYERPL